MTVLARYPKGGSVDLARGAAAPDADTVDLVQLLGALWRRKWLILLVALLGAVGGWLYGKRQIPLYTAQAAVVVEPRESNVVDFKKVLAGLKVDEAVIATEMALIQSRTTLARVMRDLGLYDDPEFNPSLAPEEPSLLARLVEAPVRRLAGELPPAWTAALGLGGDEAPPTAAERRELERLFREVATDVFSARVKVGNDGISYVITVGFVSEDPDKAARIANRLAEVYVEDQIKSKETVTGRANSYLEQRMNAMREEVQKADNAVARYKAEHNLLDARGTILSEQELSDLNKELIQARGELAERQAKLRLVRELRGSGRGLDAISDVTGSPVIIALRAEETALVRQEAELGSQFGPRHPRMVQLERDKASLAAKVRAEIDRIAVTLDNDARVVQARIATIEGQLAGVKGRNVQDRAAEVRLKELERQAESSRELYQSFLQRFKETREQQDLVEADARIVTLAAPPVSPSTPGRKLYLLAGFSASLVLGSLVALVLDRLDRALRSPREVERLLGLPTMGMVPRLERLRRNQKPWQYLMDKPLSAYAEAIRAVYMGVRLGHAGPPGRLVLVTSSLPEEGKTTLAVSLAVFAARSRKRVLLIDLDLRHPSVHRELGWQVGAGLVEHMTGERALDEVIQHDVETGLDFLPVKAQTTNPTDLIDSEPMRDLLELCRARYDLVVLDTAPVASVTDARALALMVDKVVFAVQWGRTVAGVAQESVQALRELGADLAGVVLTRVDLARHAGYGYGDIGQYYNRSKKYYVN